MSITRQDTSLFRLFLVSNRFTPDWQPHEHLSVAVRFSLAARSRDDTSKHVHWIWLHRIAYNVSFLKREVKFAYVSLVSINTIPIRVSLLPYLRFNLTKPGIWYDSLCCETLVCINKVILSRPGDVCDIFSFGLTVGNGIITSYKSCELIWTLEKIKKKKRDHLSNELQIVCVTFSPSIEVCML